MLLLTLRKQLLIYEWSFTDLTFETRKAEIGSNVRVQKD